MVKVGTRASRNAVLGWHDAMLKVAVTAVPEHGKANAAVQALLARSLRLPKSAITLLQGDTRSQKLFDITGLDDGEILRRLPGFVA
ncbi:DUF167 domain-containing protein [Solimonas terrae]|uniref:UPF0235 protein G7Y85_16755 n=1 Tax=Solimonas terrae TaxID=1396819 RepID=A0A6M2BVY9_9GAMM|nr:DUF167 family protein [Solimonas terrae]NGY06425.1 DUF167 domain-containing protein [Solimonas terrae]